MSAMSSVRRWLPCVAGVVSVALLAGAVWYDLQHLRPERHKRACKAHLKQLLTALHSYHDEHHCFPPAYTLGPDGERWHSWRVLILPQLGEQELHAQYRFGEPWNSPHNAKLANRMPAAFGYPGEPHAKFLAVVGTRTAWPEFMCTGIRDFVAGTSNSVMLVESADSQLNWLEPRDISFGQALKRKAASATPRFVGRTDVSFAGFADGTARALVPHTPRERLRRLLTATPSDSRLERVLSKHSSVEPTPAPTFPVQRSASTFSQTDVLPYPSMPIKPQRNYLYCCTFRIAWDGLRLAPGARVPAKPMPIIAAELNRLPFPYNSLAPDSYLAMATDAVDVGLINAEMARRFPGAQGPKTIPAAVPQKEKVIFAFLNKGLPFAAEFEKLKTPLAFPNGTSTIPVASFGRMGVGAAGGEVAKQVRILDYRTDSDFILELKTESERDHMILSKIPVESTMQETIDKTMARIQKPNPQHGRFALENPEDLIVPKLSFNILKTYHDLHGVNTDEFEGAIIVRAEQGTAFVLNESGAELESYAEIEQILGDFGDDSGTPPPPKIRHFVFDKPFLVLLREKQATEPYFALWVANAELMEPFAK